MAGGSAPAGAASRPLDAKASAAPPAHASTARELIVRFEASASAGERSDALEAADASAVRTLGLRGVRLVRVDAGQTVAAAVRELRADDDVDWAEPNRVVSIARVPSDELYGSLWGLPKIGAPAAWDTVTGSDDVVVAVADTGIDYSHPDLAGSAWVNPGESGGGHETNGVDDDGDGFVDDVHGWDWIGNDPDGEDLNGHGTHVSGTIAARGDDGVGVTGVAWRSQLMALRVCDAGGSCPISHLITAMDYAGRKGARVFNASLGGFFSSQAIVDAAAAHPGTMYAFAAGNNSADLDATGTDFYPCEASRHVANAICVGATGQADQLAYFSNYGDAVGIAAPGMSIVSTYPGARYVSMNGTSMATPHVAGAAALIAAARPGASGAQLVDAVRRGAFVPSLVRRVDAAARLDLVRALRVEPLAALDAPAIDGDPIAGRDVHGTPGVWDGDRAAVAYQWQSSAGGGAFADIAGATGRYLHLPRSLLGADVRLRVTAGDGVDQVVGYSDPVTVVEVPPETYISWGPDESNVSFGFWSEPWGLAFECRIDGEPWSGCSSPYSRPDVGPGDHVFWVRARNGDGDVDPTPASFGFTIAAPPAATPTQTPTPTPAASPSPTPAPPAAPGAETGTRDVSGGDRSSAPAGTALMSLGAAVLIDPAATASDPGGADPGVDLGAGRVSGGTLVAREAIVVDAAFAVTLPGARASASAAARRVVLGRRRIELRAGEAAPLTVRLPAQAGRLLGGAKRVSVRIRLRVRSVATGLAHTYMRTTSLRVVRTR